MKLYENVIIGNFLYALGFAVGAKSKSNIGPSIVNLLQQTPADQVLADVLLAFPGVVRLIEFKRFENKDNKEKDKHQKLSQKLLTSAISRNDIKLSKSIHWFIETTSTEQTFVSRIVPYLEAYPKGNCQRSLEEFIETTADDAVYGEKRFSDEEISCYLALIGHCHVSDTPNKKPPNPIQPGGVLLRVDSQGNLRFGELTDMRQLLLLHREYIREHKEFEQQRELRIERELIIDRSNSPSQGLER